MIANFTENEGTWIVAESIAKFQLILLILTFVIVNIVLITYVAWIAYLIKSMNKPRREGETEKGTSITNLSINGKKGKLLLALLVFESLSITFYELAALLGYVFRNFPDLRFLGINWNISCSSEIAVETHWLGDLQFPEVSFFVCLGRANLLIGLAVATSFIKFVTNSYVTESWKYKNILKGVWFVIPLCILIIVFGTIPQTMLIVWAVNIVVFITYFYLANRSIAFLNRALGWREQDLKCYDEYEQLRMHRKVTSRFRISIRLVMIGLALLILHDIMEQIEMVLSLFLFYGQCVFPAVYGIAYTAPIKLDDLAIFKLVLCFSNLIQGILLIAAACFLMLPQVILTLLIPLFSCLRAVNGGDRRNIRFRIVMSEPLLSPKNTCIQTQ